MSERVERDEAHAHRRYWRAEAPGLPPVLGVTEREWDGTWYARRVALEDVCSAAEVKCANEDAALSAVRRLLDGLGAFVPSPFVATQGVRRPAPQAPEPPPWAPRQR